MWTFRAMGTEVAVAAPTVPADVEHALAGAIADLFADTERRFSRFRDDSELTRLNRATGPIEVSPELAALLAIAQAHAAATGGLFDPTVGGALEAAGYDRSFAPGALDRPARLVRRPDTVQLDLGGFLKGRTVDRAAARLPGPGFVDAGGDAFLRGDDPVSDRPGWPVEVEDPADPTRTLLTLRVRDRGVATSAPNRRRWRLGAGEAHHLIDPRTRRPARSDLAQVTVVAPTAEQADVLATAVFVAGAGPGAALLSGQPDVGAVLLDRTGEVRLVGDVEVDRD